MYWLYLLLCAIVATLVSCNSRALSLEVLTMFEGYKRLGSTAFTPEFVRFIGEGASEMEQLHRFAHAIGQGGDLDVIKAAWVRNGVAREVSDSLIHVANDAYNKVVPTSYARRASMMELNTRSFIRRLGRVMTIGSINVKVHGFFNQPWLKRVCNKVDAAFNVIAQGLGKDIAALGGSPARMVGEYVDRISSIRLGATEMIGFRHNGQRVLRAQGIAHDIATVQGFDRCVPNTAKMNNIIRKVKRVLQATNNAGGIKSMNNHVATLFNWRQVARLCSRRIN